MSKKVEEQKGPIEANQPTSKQKSHYSHVVEKAEEMRMLKENQTLHFHTPKQGKK